MQRAVVQVISGAGIQIGQEQDFRALVLRQCLPHCLATQTELWIRAFRQTQCGGQIDQLTALGAGHRSGPRGRLHSLHGLTGRRAGGPRNASQEQQAGQDAKAL